MVLVVITFGVQYGTPPNREHPAFPGIDAGKGWLTVEAPTRALAYQLATLICGTDENGWGRWAFDYDYDTFMADPANARFFPLGEFARARFTLDVHEHPVPLLATSAPSPS